MAHLRYRLVPAKRALPAKLVIGVSSAHRVGLCFKLIGYTWTSKEPAATAANSESERYVVASFDTNTKSMMLNITRMFLQLCLDGIHMHSFLTPRTIQ